MSDIKDEKELHAGTLGKSQAKQIVGSRRRISGYTRQDDQFLNLRNIVEKARESVKTEVQDLISQQSKQSND